LSKLVTGFSAVAHRVVGGPAPSYNAEHDNSTSARRFERPRCGLFRAMTLQSMTGFARTAGQDEFFAWTWEARSVNARGLDVRCRVPNGYEAVEQAVRAAAAKMFQRGNITIGVSVERIDQASARFRINRDLLDQVQALRAELGDTIADTPPTIDGLLSIRGMLEPVDATEDEDKRAARESAMIVSGQDMLTALSVARSGEGQRLDDIMAGHLDILADLTQEAANNAATQPEAIRERLAALIGELLGAEPKLPEERLAQEVAVLVGKADIREELDRLAVHVAAVRELLEDGVAVGRRLDFLCQELNREANTLCSKSADVDLTRIGLAMKATIEQFREQVQNVE
jgi:uncharacterized protein (TIGR00255 family)